MAVVIQEMTAEVPEAAPRPPEPPTPAGAPGDQVAAFGLMRAAMLRDAQRQARLWAD